MGTALMTEHGMGILRILTDRGTEYCGRAEYHDYKLYLAVNDIDHTKTKTRSPKTNGICERFHRTSLEEFYRLTFRKKIYESLDELQSDLDEWMSYYNRNVLIKEECAVGEPPCKRSLKGKQSGRKR